MKIKVWLFKQGDYSNERDEFVAVMHNSQEDCRALEVGGVLRIDGETYEIFKVEEIFDENSNLISLMPECDRQH